MPLLLWGANRANVDTVAVGRLLPSAKEIVQIGATFSLTVFAWIFFRAESVTHAWSIVKEIFSPSLISKPAFLGKYALVFGLIIFFMTVEWLGRERQFAIQKMFLIPSRTIRWACYSALIAIIYVFGNFSDAIEFIYFQF